MALTPSRPIQLSMEKRRGEVERARTIQGQTYRISYFLDVVGAGETTVPVNFPVLFQERPGCSMGGELGPNEVLEDTNFPWCSVMVHRWDTVEKEGSILYKGATLILVVGGTTTQRATLHFHVEGKALTTPNSG